MKDAPGFRAILNEAETRAKKLSIRGVKQRFDTGGKFTLVDVREHSEWARSHLPRAIHLDKGIIERDIELAGHEAGGR
jgi:rhodanese-related sulfurtransferase